MDERSEMPNVFELVKNPMKINNLLANKYGDITDDYNSLFTDALIYSKNCHIFSLYKEYLIWDFSDEFLKRFYNVHESIERLPKISNYYKNYLKFFCNPFFRDFKKNEIIQSFGDNKAEIYYKNNYGDKKKKQKQEHAIRSLNNSDDSNESKGAVSMLFDTTVRGIIDKNIITQATVKTQNNTNTSSNFIINDSNYLNYSIKSDLLTKRSKDESLMNILSNLGEEVNFEINERFKGKLIKSKRVLIGKNVSSSDKTTKDGTNSASSKIKFNNKIELVSGGSGSSNNVNNVLKNNGSNVNKNLQAQILLNHNTAHGVGTFGRNLNQKNMQNILLNKNNTKTYFNQPNHQNNNNNFPMQFVTNSGKSSAPNIFNPQNQNNPLIQNNKISNILLYTVSPRVTPTPTTQENKLLQSGNKITTTPISQKKTMNQIEVNNFLLNNDLSSQTNNYKRVQNNRSNSVNTPNNICNYNGTPQQFESNTNILSSNTNSNAYNTPNNIPPTKKKSSYCNLYKMNPWQKEDDLTEELVNQEGERPNIVTTSNNIITNKGNHQAQGSSMIPTTNTPKKEKPTSRINEFRKNKPKQQSNIETSRFNSTTRNYKDHSNNNIPSILPDSNATIGLINNMKISSQNFQNAKIKVSNSIDKKIQLVQGARVSSVINSISNNIYQGGNNFSLQQQHTQVLSSPKIHEGGSKNPSSKYSKISIINKPLNTQRPNSTNTNSKKNVSSSVGGSNFIHSQSSASNRAGNEVMFQTSRNIQISNHPNKGRSKEYSSKITSYVNFSSKLLSSSQGSLGDFFMFKSMRKSQSIEKEDRDKLINNINIQNQNQNNNNNNNIISKITVKQVNQVNPGQTASRNKNQQLTNNDNNQILLQTGTSRNMNTLYKITSINNNPGGNHLINIGINEGITHKIKSKLQDFMRNQERTTQGKKVVSLSKIMNQSNKRESVNAVKQSKSSNTREINNKHFK
jgi:hypothetical protein